MQDLNVNKPVLKAESGLFLEPEQVAEKVKNETFEKYNSRYTKNLAAPTPNVKVPYNYILTRAVPPEMKGYTSSGLIINELQIDVRELKQMQIMSDNVNNEQEVLLIGPHVTKENGCDVQPGDIVKLEFKNYRELHDDHTAGVIQTSYRIPMYKIDGNEYLLLNARDILYIMPKKENK